MFGNHTFSLKGRHARSNKNSQPIVKVAKKSIYSSGINDISFGHLYNMYDTKFIPMIMGLAEIIEKNGKKFVRFYDIKDVKLYQAWDKSTLESNIGKRQVFNMPVGAFLHAIGLYEKNLKEVFETKNYEGDVEDYFYKPTCILRTYKKDTEFPGIFVSPNIVHSIVKKDKNSSVSYLDFEVSNEGTNGMEEDYDFLTKIKTSDQRVLMRLNMSAIRYETLNTNRYLTHHNKPAPLYDNIKFPGYRFDKSLENGPRNLNNVRRKNKVANPLSMDFLASDRKCSIFKLENGNYGLYMPNLKHIVAYQVWNYNTPDGNKEKRAIKDIEVGHFLSMVHSVHDKHRQLGVSSYRADFQPTTTIETIDAYGRRNIYLGVIRSFNRDERGLEDGTITFSPGDGEGLFLEISTHQMFDSDNNSPTNELVEGTYEVHLNIDSWWSQLLCQLGIGIAIAILMIFAPAAAAVLIELDTGMALVDSALTAIGETVLGTFEVAGTITGSVLGIVGAGASTIFSVSIDALSLGALDGEEVFANTVKILSKTINKLDTIINFISTLGLNTLAEDSADYIISKLGVVDNPEIIEDSGGAGQHAVVDSDNKVKTVNDYFSLRAKRRSLAIGQTLDNIANAGLINDTYSDISTIQTILGSFEERSGTLTNGNSRSEVIASTGSTSEILKNANANDLALNLSNIDSSARINDPSKYTLLTGDPESTEIFPKEKGNEPFVSVGSLKIKGDSFINLKNKEQVLELKYFLEVDNKFFDTDGTVYSKNDDGTFIKESDSENSKNLDLIKNNTSLTLNDIIPVKVDRLTLSKVSEMLDSTSAVETYYDLSSQSILEIYKEFRNVDDALFDTLGNADPILDNIPEESLKKFAEISNEDINSLKEGIASNSNLQEYLDNQNVEYKYKISSEELPNLIKAITTIKTNIPSAKLYSEIIDVNKEILDSYIQNKTAIDIYKSKGLIVNSTEKTNIELLSGLTDSQLKDLTIIFNSENVDEKAIAMTSLVGINTVETMSIIDSGDTVVKIGQNTYIKGNLNDLLTTEIEGTSASTKFICHSILLDTLKQELELLQLSDSDFINESQKLDGSITSYVKIGNNQGSSINSNITDLIEEYKNLQIEYDSLEKDAINLQTLDLSSLANRNDTKQLSAVSTRLNEIIKTLNSKIATSESTIKDAVDTLSKNKGAKITTFQPSKLTTLRSNLWSAQYGFKLVNNLVTRKSKFNNLYKEYILAANTVNELIATTKKNIATQKEQQNKTVKPSININLKTTDNIFGNAEEFEFAPTEFSPDQELYNTDQPAPDPLGIKALKNGITKLNNALENANDAFKSYSFDYITYLLDSEIKDVYSDLYMIQLKNYSDEIEKVNDIKTTTQSNKVNFVYDWQKNNNSAKLTSNLQKFVDNYSVPPKLTLYDSYEGVKTLDIWDFSQPNYVNKDLHQLMLHSVGITAGELLFIKRIDEQLNILNNYVNLVKQASDAFYGWRTYKGISVNKAEAEVLKFCKNNTFLLPNDLFNPNPQPVEFCPSGVIPRSQTMYSSGGCFDTVQFSAISRISSCKLQFPVNGAYVQTWEGVRDLYKKYKKSQYTQQLQASLTMVNSVVLIIKGLGEAVLKNKISLVNGENDKFLFANDNFDLGIMTFSENSNPSTPVSYVDGSVKKTFENAKENGMTGTYYSVFLSGASKIASTLKNSSWYEKDNQSMDMNTLNKQNEILEAMIEFMQKYPITFKTNSAIAIARYVFAFAGILMNMYKEISNNFKNGEDFTNWVEQLKEENLAEINKKSAPATQVQKDIGTFYKTMTKVFKQVYNNLMNELNTVGLLKKTIEKKPPS